MRLRLCACWGCEPHPSLLRVLPLPLTSTLQAEALAAAAADSARAVAELQAALSAAEDRANSLQEQLRLSQAAAASAIVGSSAISDASSPAGGAPAASAPLSVTGLYLRLQTAEEDLSAEKRESGRLRTYLSQILAQVRR